MKGKEQISGLINSQGPILKDYGKLFLDVQNCTHLINLSGNSLLHGSYNNSLAHLLYKYQTSVYTLGVNKIKNFHTRMFVINVYQR